MKIEKSAVDEQELKVAEEAAKEDSIAYGNKYTHTSSKPFSFDGNTVEELEFDWDKLTASDSLAIEHEVESMGKAVIVPEFSGDYLIRMAARACTTTVEVAGKKTKLGTDVFLHLPLRDYNKIRSKARSFLLMSD